MRALPGEFRTYALAQLAHADDPKAVKNYFDGACGHPPCSTAPGHCQARHEQADG
ncbi:chemotaxis protein [Xanthomonas oryzae pv. oryzicola]|nr:chemotaxis protein [Xanthomonas oryzae pv. oryzicola]